MQEKYRNLLSEFIRFRTVSALADNDDQIDDCLKWLEKIFKENNFETQIYHGYDNPVFVSSLMIAEEFPTVLIYGHYDVQPASVEDGWDHEPFELEELEDRYTARGVVDNKGQVLVHMVAAFEAMATKKLRYNLKFILEGNEETGSPNIERFLSEYKDDLESDFVLISDGVLVQDKPTIEIGLRGTFNCELTVKTSTKELHSGLYGGVAPNAVYELSRFVGSLLDENRKITIPGFYDNVISDDQISGSQLEITEAKFKKLTDTGKILTEPGYDFYEQVGLRPALEVTGFTGGYIGEGFRNSIPNVATVKLNFRLVPGQEPSEILELLKTHAQSFFPDYVTLEFRDPKQSEGMIEAVRLDSGSKYHKLVTQYLSSVYGEPVVYTLNGATLPIINSFAKVFAKPLVMVPLANEDSGMHSAFENFKIEYLEKALTFSLKLLSND